MIGAVILWARRLWPFGALATLLIAAFALLRSCGDQAPALREAHQATVVAEHVVFVADSVVRVDTVERRVVVVHYQTLRDSARAHLTDSVLVARTLDAADSSVAASDTTIDHMRRASEAKDILIGALRTELRISEKLRAPRFRVSSYAGVDVDGAVPVTGAEIEVRVKDRWSVVGRLDKRWAPGEGTHRLLFVRYTL